MTRDPFGLLLEPFAGYDFAVVFAQVTEDQVTPVNLTGRTFSAQIRHAPGDLLVTSFTVSVPTPANGEVVLSLDESQTALAGDAGPAALWWSLKEDAAGVTTALCGGPLIVRRVVTV